jgi:hypothetical protein
MGREYGKNQINKTHNAMKVNLKIRKKKALELSYGQMVANTLEIIKTICVKVTDKCIGRMVQFTKDNGKMESKLNKSQIINPSKTLISIYTFRLKSL